MNFWDVRAELMRLEPTDLLKMALNQREHNCVLNPNGSCPYYFKYKGLSSVFQNSQARDAKQKKQGKEGRIQRLLSPTLKLKTGTKRY